MSGELRLDVRLLGTGNVYVGGSPVSVSKWERRKAKRIVMLLALQPQHRMHREQIIESLWPDLQPSAAVNNLHRTIHQARRALEPELPQGGASSFIRTNAGYVELVAPGGLTVDLEEFLARAAEAKRSNEITMLESALALYRGDLLADEPYEDWAAAHRERVRAVRDDLVGALVNIFMERGRFEAAIERLRQLLESDPANENAHRTLMRAYASNGRRDLALRQYAVCEQAVREHIGLPPERETTALFQQIAEASATPAQVAAPQTPRPAFRQLTFRRGTVRAGRFAPDGKSFFCAAAWEGGALEMFRGELRGGKISEMGLQGTGLLAVSPSGHIAVALDRHFVRGYVNAGRLAVVAPEGGAPREVGPEVHWADWSPNGESLLVVRDEDGFNRIEYPLGRVIYRTSGWVSHPRISPDGKAVAFINHPVLTDDGGEVALLLFDDTKKVLSGGWVSAQGLSWLGRSIWFTASRSGNTRKLYSVRPDGEERFEAEVAGALTLHDIAPDGTALVSRDDTRLGITFSPGAAGRDVDLSCRDWSLVRDISGDGKRILITEAGEGGGPDYGVYLRKVNGSPPVFLGDGSAMALSPDGRWALTLRRKGEAQLVLLPTKPGREDLRPLGVSELNYHPWAAWHPDGESVLFIANPPNAPAQLYVQRVGGPPTPVAGHDTDGTQLTTPQAVSPDGSSVVLLTPDRGTIVYDLKRGVMSKRVVGVRPGEVPTRWSEDGRALYVYSRGTVPARVIRLDLRTGRRELVKSVAPADLTGVHEVLRLLLTRDAAACVYTYTRDLSALYTFHLGRR